MSSESIPVGLQTLLAKHYFLAQITRGYKPCMTNMTLIDGSSWLGSLYRAWCGETRKTVMSDIEKIISETIDSISTHHHKPEFLRLIINALASTRVGIESMTTTYRTDPDMVGRLQVQLTNIDLQLKKYRDLIKGYNIPDERLIDEVVKNAETTDAQGFRNFLIGKKSEESSSDKSVDQVRRRRRPKPIPEMEYHPK